MQRVITWDQYAKHTNNLDCWLLVEGKIYNLTTFLAEHPGGDEVLLKYSGLDATKPFIQQNHTPYAVSIRDARLEGSIQNQPMPQGHQRKVQQIKREYIQLKKKRDQQRRKDILKNAPPVEKSSNPSIPSNAKVFTREQVATHNTSKDCWVIFNDKVYDVTSYLPQHPGGQFKISDLAGTDATKDFEKVGHSDNARRIRQKHLVGYLPGYRPPKGRISNELIGMAILTILFVLYTVYFFNKRQ